MGLKNGITAIRFNLRAHRGETTFNEYKNCYKKKVQRYNVITYKRWSNNVRIPEHLNWYLGLTFAGFHVSSVILGDLSFKGAICTHLKPGQNAWLLEQRKKRNQIDSTVILSYRLVIQGT